MDSVSWSFRLARWFQEQNTVSPCSCCERERKLNKAASQHSVPIRDDGLQLEEHRGFQERFWTIERWAWAVFGLILLGALAGLAGGGGFFAHATIASEAGEVDYPRVARWESPDEITVRFGSSGAEHRLILSPRFSEYFQIEDIQPMPDRSLVSPAGEVMVFPSEHGPPAKVVLHLRAQRPGLARYDVSLDGGNPVGVATLVLP
jgi:hypothetical protein